MREGKKVHVREWGPEKREGSGPIKDVLDSQYSLLRHNHPSIMQLFLVYIYLDCKQSYPFANRGGREKKDPMLIKRNRVHFGEEDERVQGRRKRKKVHV